MGNTNNKKSITVSSKVKALASVNAKFGSSKNKELTENDFNYLTKQTKFSREEIKAIFEQFHANNSDGKLNQNEFIELYCKLRPEPEEVLNKISEFVFRAFDNDKNGKILTTPLTDKILIFFSLLGFISFHEFLVSLKIQYSLLWLNFH